MSGLACVSVPLCLAIGGERGHLDLFVAVSHNDLKVNAQAVCKNDTASQTAEAIWAQR